MTNIGLFHALDTLQDTTLGALYADLVDAKDEMEQALDCLNASPARDELAKDADELNRLLLLVKRVRRSRQRRQGDVK